PARAIHHRSAARPLHHGRALRALGHQPEDRLQKTGYKWLERYESGGRPALRERSHAPHRCTHRIPDEIAALICAARAAHPNRDPDKLLDWRRPRHPELSWPAVSTAGDLLARLNERDYIIRG
ncbi:MAG: leucine zipper domain-containing protein, partial [Gemmatimonadaceae bacterium]